MAERFRTSRIAYLKAVRTHPAERMNAANGSERTSARFPDQRAAKRGCRNPLTVRNMLLQSVASASLLCLSDLRAFAACVEAPPGTLIIECRGQINSGFTSAGLSVTVNADSTAVFNAPVTIEGPGTSTFNNLGTANADVIAIGNTSFTLNNAGVLDNAVRATDNGTFQLNNHGLIDGGVFLAGSGVNNIINFADGQVQNGVTSTGNSNDAVINLGFFAGSISLGAGDDVLDLAAGDVQTSVDMGSGNDNFRWIVGNVAATVQMGDGDDTALFVRLTQNNLTAGKIIDGGLGTDTLTWDHTTNDQGAQQGDQPTNIVNWEDFRLTNRSQLRFIFTTGVLTLGDTQTGTGTLSIDSTSSVLAGNSFGYGVVPFDSSQLVTVNNAGAIDLTNDSPAPGTGTSLHDTFTIHGNYVGQDGRLLLNTFLGTDNSPSDRLVIENGAGSGSTSILVTNVDGPGALTTGNGIQVVDATNGATTTAGAFALGGPVAAGVFEYNLFRGGVTPSAATDNDWFLRNTVSPPPPPP
ncbi:MAG: hypothetical protein EOS30_25805, partial [Mesorhizobium sp.]